MEKLISSGNITVMRLATLESGIRKDMTYKYVKSIS
jgi:hypothetical protein